MITPEKVYIDEEFQTAENRKLLEFIIMMYGKIDELGWNPDDELDIEIAEYCTDNGEYDSLVVINKTIEGNNLKTDNEN